VSADATVLCTGNARTSTLKRCLVQPLGCVQQPKSSQPQPLGETNSPLVSPRPTPPPRRASVCPL